MTDLAILAQQMTEQSKTSERIVTSVEYNWTAIWILCGVVYLFLVVMLGGIPGRTARKRGHISASAVSAMGWLGMLLCFPVWIAAIIWANSGPDHTREAARARAHRRAEKRHAMEGVSEDKIDDAAAALENLDH